MEKFDLRPLKTKAIKIGGPFRDVVVSQPDTMTREEFLTKAPDWMRLLLMEKTE